MSGTLHYFYESYGESAPLAVPPSVVVTGLTSRVRSATATFTECPAPFPGQPDIWYVVTAVHTVDGSVHTAQGNHSPITVGGLTNGAEYTVSVTAHNFVGASEPCSYAAGVNPVVHVYDVPAAPTLNDVIQINANTLERDFTQDAYNGGTPVFQYTLYLVNPQGVAFQWHLLSGGSAVPVVGTSPALIGGLAINTLYSITVTATNAAGESLPSNIIFRSTPRAPVVSGTSLVGSIGSVAVNITADGFGQVIDKYNIQFYRQNRLDVPYKTVTSTTPNLTVKSLPPAEVITVMVQGHNKWGWGAWQSSNVQLDGVAGGMFAPNVTIDKVVSRNIRITIDQPTENVEAWDYAMLHGFVRYKLTDSLGNIRTLGVDANRRFSGWVYPVSNGNTGDPYDWVNGINPQNGVDVSFSVEVESHTYGLSAPSDDFSFKCLRRPNLVTGTRLVPTGSTSLYAEWDAPESNGGSPVLDYLVTLWESTPGVLVNSYYGADPARNPAWTRVVGKDVISSGNACYFEGLKSGKGYLILVQARNEIGYSYPNYDSISQYYDASANTFDAANKDATTGLINDNLDLKPSHNWGLNIVTDGYIGGAITMGISGANWTWMPRAGSTNKFSGVTATKRVSNPPNLGNGYTDSASMDGQIVFRIYPPAFPAYDTPFQQALNYGDNYNKVYAPNLVSTVIYDKPTYYSLEDASGNVYWEGYSTPPTGMSFDTITFPVANGPVYKLRLRAYNDCGWSAYSGFVGFQPQGAPAAIPEGVSVIAPIWNGQIYVMINYDGSAMGGGNGYAIDTYMFKIINNETGATYYEGTMGTTVFAPSTLQWLTDHYGEAAAKNQKYGTSGTQFMAYYANFPNVGHSYSFYCKVHNARGWSGYTYLGSGTNGQPPSVPRPAVSNLTDLLQITFRWTAPATNNGYPVDYYEVYWGDSSKSFSVDSRNPNHGTTVDTSYTVGGLEPNKNYFMWVRAVNAMGASGWYSTGYVLTQNVPNLVIALTPVVGKYSEGTTDGTIIVGVTMGYGTDNNSIDARGTPVDWVQLFNRNSDGSYHTLDLIWEGWLPYGRTNLVIGGLRNGITPVIAARAHNAIGWSVTGGGTSMLVPYGPPLVAPDNFRVNSATGNPSNTYLNFQFTIAGNTPANNNGNAWQYFRVYTTHGETFTISGSVNWGNWIGGSAGMHGQNVGFYICAVNTAGEGPMAYTEHYIA